MHKPGTGRWCYFFYFFLALAANPVRVIAAEYYIEPSVTARYEYDNNRRLRDPAESASTWRFSPFVAFGRLTPNSEVTGAARVEVNESNREELDSTDVYAGLFPVYRTERSEWSLDTTYRRDTTLRTNILEPAFIKEQPLGVEILPAPDPDDLQREDPDLGLRRQEEQRNVVLVSPGWRRELSPRLDLGLRYTYIDTFYGDGGSAGQGLVDSRRHLGRANLSYRFSEVDDVSVLTTFQNFKNDENREFDTYRLQFGLEHRFSETLAATLRVGPEYTDRSSGSSGKDDFGYSVGFGVNKKLESSQLAVVFRRGVAPNEAGDALDRNQVDLRWFGDLSARWSFSILARAFRNESSAGSASASNTRSYAQIEPRIGYRITEDLSCDLGYRFRWEDDDSPGGGSAFAHAGLFSVNYAFDRFSLSR